MTRSIELAAVGVGALCALAIVCDQASALSGREVAELVETLEVGERDEDSERRIPVIRRTR